MEILGLINLPDWLVGILTFLFTVCLYTWYKQSYFKRLGIPTKYTVFFLGDLVEMTKKGFGYTDYDLYKKYGKVFGSYLGNVPTLFISDPDMLKQITVKEFNKFTNRAQLVNVDTKWHSSVSVAEDDHWRFLRHTLSPTFTSGKMRYMSPYIHRCLDIFHDILEETIRTS